VKKRGIMMEKLQFIYKLELVPRLIADNNWTEEDNQVVQRHFEVLQMLLEENKLVLAGRTLNTDPFGIVILQVDSEEEAKDIMENDPAVKEKIMTAELYPYRVALLNKNFSVGEL
jgi:uncharacterized protein